MTEYVCMYEIYLMWIMELRVKKLVYSQVHKVKYSKLKIKSYNSNNNIHSKEFLKHKSSME